MVFGDGCRDAPARCRETSERSGLRRRSPPPPRLDFRIKWGPAAAAALLRGPARAASTARRAHSAPCLAARSQGFPPGPCAAASCRSSCWRWSSARRPGDRPLRCRRRETPSWPRCTRAATTGRWVSVRRAPVLGGTRPPQGAGSPALSVWGARLQGLGLLPPFYPGVILVRPELHSTLPRAESPRVPRGCGLAPGPFRALFPLPRRARAGARLPETPSPARRRPLSLRTYPAPPFIPHGSLLEQLWGARSPSATLSSGPVQRRP